MTEDTKKNQSPARHGLPKVVVEGPASTLEVYPHGAHVTHFQKNGESPLLFLSRKSFFRADKAIRGGIPICFPWFGAREGTVMHGVARLSEWQLSHTKQLPDGSSQLTFALPPAALTQAGWPAAKVEFIVTATDILAMELRVENTSAQPFEFEACLHTYFLVGDISQVSITGLKGLSYLDKVDDFTRKQETADAIRITSEVDRVYLNSTGTVAIHDAKLRRVITVEKSGSASTVVWNPWIDKAKAMSDFDPEEYRTMVCVESGNVGESKITLPPGKTASLKVVLSSAPMS